MTKSVRIENADTSEYKVIVETWETENGVPVKISEAELPFPTSMMTGMIHNTRWLVIREGSK